MRVAIVHDWLTGMRGGENCLEVFCELFPDATLFTLVHKKHSVSRKIESMKIKTSFLQRLPLAIKHYKHYLPLFPKAIESFDLSGFDLILSSSHCVAKGVRKPAAAKHICYCYTPMRYAWLFFDDYFANMGLLRKIFVSGVISRLKSWDIKSNEGVDFFIAISDNVRDRIRRFYNRESEVIPCPVDISKFSIGRDKGDYYLVVSAFVPYKRIDLAVEAFNKLGKRLLIIGSGPCEKELRKKADKNIEFLGWMGDEKLKYYQGCRALIFPGEEDFGIVPLEAQACGRPVIAFGKGGALETVTQKTGVFFYQQTAEALAQAIGAFEEKESAFDSKEIRVNAQRFDRALFKSGIREFIESKLHV